MDKLLLDQITEAKRRLLKVLLKKETDYLTSSEVIVMGQLTCDPDVQAILEKSGEKWIGEQH